jgi:predicted transcriptional regulator
MKQSKLDVYIELLYKLNQQEPQKPTMLFDKLNTNESCLKARMTFLIDQGLVEKRKIGKQVTYENTQKGIVILNYLRKNHQVNPYTRVVPALNS